MPSHRCSTARAPRCASPTLTAPGWRAVANSFWECCATPRTYPVTTKSRACAGSCYGAWGGIDALVNNVGIAGPTAALEDVTPEDWERTLRVNVNSHFYCCKAVTPAMKAAGGGSIVHISSTAGFTGFPLRAPYTVSKWAVIGLARTLAMELGEFGIRVNAVCPGSVRGPRIERVIAAEAAAGGRPPEYVRDCYERQVSMRTFVDAVDVAETVSFLCSERAARISGQVLSVDGNTESLRTPVPAPGDAR